MMSENKPGPAECPYCKDSNLKDDKNNSLKERFSNMAITGQQSGEMSTTDLASKELKGLDGFEQKVPLVCEQYSFYKPNTTSQSSVKTSPVEIQARRDRLVLRIESELKKKRERRKKEEPRPPPQTPIFYSTKKTEVASYPVIETSMFTCGKCHSKTCTYQLQERGIDQPMATVICCLSCGNSWTF